MKEGKPLVFYYLEQRLSACQWGILWSANNIISYIRRAQIALVTPAREAEWSYLQQRVLHST